MPVADGKRTLMAVEKPTRKGMKSGMKSERISDHIIAPTCTTDEVTLRPCIGGHKRSDAIASS